MSHRELKTVTASIFAITGALFALCCIGAAGAATQEVHLPLLATAVAAPASQPVAAAVAAPGVWPWLVANSPWLVPLVIAVLSTLATGLSEYPKAGKVVRFLRLAVSVLSLATFKNSPGSLKPPFVPSARPADPPAPGGGQP